MGPKDAEVEQQMTIGKKDAGQQEMIEKAALSPLLAPLTPEEFAKADQRVSGRFVMHLCRQCSLGLHEEGEL